MENPVRTTTLYVVKQAKNVRINQEKIQKVAITWNKKQLTAPVWPTEFHLQTKNQQKMLDYLFLLDSINFCFWPTQILPSAKIVTGKPQNKWRIKYKNKNYDGYFGLSLALKKFFEENPNKTSLNYFSKIPYKEFLSILQGGEGLQLLKKRWQIVRAVSSVLIKKYETTVKFIKSANQKLSALVQKIYRELPYFDDIGYYNGQKVYFFKRAQILCADIWGAFRGRGLGYFKDLEDLTAFADYKVPQMLRHLGILEYSSALKKKIKNKTLIPAGSSQEIEMRAATIWAVEYLTKKLTRLGKSLYPFQVDWLLWNKSQEIRVKMPHHLTRSIFY